MVNRNSRAVMVPARSPWPSFQGAKGGHWRGSIVSPPPLPTRKRAGGKEAEDCSNQNPTPFFAPFPNVFLSSSPNNIHSSLDALVSAIFTSIAYSHSLFGHHPQPSLKMGDREKKEFGPANKKQERGKLFELQDLDGPATTSTEAGQVRTTPCKTLR